VNKVKIGNQSAFSAKTPLQPFEYSVANGFNAFEWFPDKKDSGSGWDVNDLDQKTRSYIKDTAKEHNITLSVHASLRGNPPGEESSEILFENVEFAQHIGATLLNIHLVNEEGIEPFIDSIKPVIMYTSRAGIQLSIENTPLSSPDDFNVLFSRLEKRLNVPTSHVGMCLDIGHANLHESTRNNYLKFIELLGPSVPVIHMHMHENFGDRDSHLSFFTGPAARDTSAVQGIVNHLKKRGFSGSVILEQWPDPPLLLNEARDRLYHMFNSPE
jgi:sugar phosphate isomerase/epimerase